MQQTCTSSCKRPLEVTSNFDAPRKIQEPVGQNSCHEEGTWAEFKAASWTKVICNGYSSAELFLRFSPKTSSQSVMPKASLCWMSSSLLESWRTWDLQGWVTLSKITLILHCCPCNLQFTGLHKSAISYPKHSRIALEANHTKASDIWMVNPYSEFLVCYSKNKTIFSSNSK